MRIVYCARRRRVKRAKRTCWPLSEGVGLMVRSVKVEVRYVPFKGWRAERIWSRGFPPLVLASIHQGEKVYAKEEGKR